MNSVNKNYANKQYHVPTKVKVVENISSKFILFPA